MCLFISRRAERVLPGRRVPRHRRVLGTGADRLRVAVWVQRPTQEDQPEAQRHDARCAKLTVQAGSVQLACGCVAPLAVQVKVCKNVSVLKRFQ